MKIGELLYRTRKEIGVEQQSIYLGICTASNYSNYENDERIPDFLTFNSILERIGQPIMSLSAYVSKKEIKYLVWRNKVSEAISRKKFLSLLKLLNDEVQVCSSLNKRLQEQFLFYVEGIIAETILHDEEKALKCYEFAVRCTCPRLIEEESFQGRVGKFEIGIFCLYVRLAIKKNPDMEILLISKLEYLCDYVLFDIKDKEEQVKIYPHLICIVGRIYKDNTLKGKKINEDLILMKERVERAYSFLKECRYMYHVTEILHLLCFFKDVFQEEYDVIKKDYQAICKLYEMFEKSIEFNPYEICENKWMFTILGDYLYKNRKKKGFSQEKICTDICEPENYSRIERGNRKPTRSRYKALADRLEIDQRYYTEILDTGNYKALLLRRKISKALFEGKYERGEELLTLLEQELGEERKNNRQYLRGVHSYIKYKTKKIEIKDRENELKQIISMTLDISDIGKNNHVYNRVEISILNQMIAVYEIMEEYEKGIELLRGFLKDMLIEENSIELRFKETYLAVLNLDKLLTNIGKYQEANDMCITWAKKAVEIGHAELLDDYLLEISYNFEFLKENIFGRSEDICNLALLISNIYGTSESQEIIKAYINKKYY